MRRLGRNALKLRFSRIPGAASGLQVVDTAEVQWNVGSVLLENLHRNQLEGALVCRCQNDRGCDTLMVCSQPVASGHAPPISRLQAGEAVDRHRRGQIVADTSLMFEKLSGHERTDRVASKILWAARTRTISIKPRNGIHTARLKRTPKNILLTHQSEYRAASNVRLPRLTRVRSGDFPPFESGVALSRYALVAGIFRQGVCVARKARARRVPSTHVRGRHL